MYTEYEFLCANNSVDNYKLILRKHRQLFNRLRKYPDIIVYRQRFVFDNETTFSLAVIFMPKKEGIQYDSWLKAGVILEASDVGLPLDVENTVSEEFVKSITERTLEYLWGEIYNGG